MSKNTLTKPCCVCLTLCNEILEDARTHSKSVISIFNSIGAGQVPTVYPRLCVLASVTNADPETPVRIAITLPSGGELFSADGKTLPGDKTSVTDFPLEVQGVLLPEAGVYTVTLEAGGELIAQRLFQVFLAPQQATATA